MIKEKIKNKTNLKNLAQIRKDSYFIFVLMSISFINLLIIFFRLIHGYGTGNIGIRTSCMVQSAIFLPLILLMAYFVFNGFRKYYNKASEKEKYKFFINSLLAMTQILVILSFEMYRFWEI